MTWGDVTRRDVSIQYMPIFPTQNKKPDDMV